MAIQQPIPGKEHAHPIAQAIMDDYDRVMAIVSGEAPGDPLSALNSLNDQGQSLLTRIALNFGKLPMAWPGRAAAEDLINAGATLTHGDGPLSSFLEMDNYAVRNALVSFSIDYLLMTGKENPLWLMVERRPDPYFITKLTDQVKRMAHEDRIDGWLRETNEYGQTPSHLLWGDGTHLMDLFGEMVECNDPNETRRKVTFWRQEMGQYWNAQSALVELGADMHAKDVSGKSPMDLCISRVENGEIELSDSPFCRAVEAEITSRALSAKTTPLSKGARATRL